MIKGLNNYVKELEKSGELLRIKEYVSPELEITEITDRFVKNSGTALLFENNGTEFPLLINVFGTYKRICQAFGVDSLDDISERIIKLFTAFSKPDKNFADKLKLIPRLKEISGYLPKHIKGRGDCQQVVITQPDLYKLPILKCWQYDGGPFITLPNVHTKDPQTGIRNVGMYRMQVLTKDTTAMHWHLHKGSAAHYNKYKQLNQKMPVSVSLGGDPVYTYCASAPLPENIDEYLLAGFIRKQAVRLVKCITNDIYIPEDADFVLEGYIDPDEAPVLEGPFGDHTGYYSLQDYYPVFHITAITHKKQAIYPATIVGIPPQEDAFLGKATERLFLPLIKLSIAPELSDMNMPFEGVFHNLVIISIKKQYPGQGAKIINALWGAGQMMFNKILIVTDDNINVSDYNSVLNAIISNCDIDKDIFFSRGPLDVLDHSSNSFAFGSKMGIDATVKYKEELSGHSLPVKPGLNNISVNIANIKEVFPEIIDINEDLCKKQIPVLLVSVKKSKNEHIKILHKALVESALSDNIKYVIYLEEIIDIRDLSKLVWRFCNNFDPVRDTYYSSLDTKFCLGLDGTRKYKTLDGFPRNWPNILVMDNKVIDEVDKKWNSLGLGEFIESPSLKFMKQVYNNGAIADE